MSQLVSSDEATPLAQQHTQPCGDCPWRRDALPGWLGGHTAQEFVDHARGDHPYTCHTAGNQECAGMAIFRRNMCKQPRHALVLPADHKAVFSTPQEFSRHHDIFNLANQKGKQQ